MLKQPIIEKKSCNTIKSNPFLRKSFRNKIIQKHEAYNKLSFKTKMTR